MHSHSPHTAPGQMAGYLFQIERTLYWLARSSRGAKVGLEAFVDDIAVKNDGNDKLVILEQDKHSISGNRSPLGNRSKDLWKTFNIWLKAIDEGDVDLDKTQFHIVTNANLPPGSILNKIASSETEVDFDRCIEQLHSLCVDVPEDLELVTQSVLNHGDNVLKDLIKRIWISDGTASTHGEQLREAIVSDLHLPSDIPTEEVIQLLTGWILEVAMVSLRERRPVWITREAFDNQYFRIVEILRNRAFRERAIDLLPVSEVERNAHRERTFVMQLLEIAVDDTNEELIGAIDSFIRCSTELTRLSHEGNITHRDIEEFKLRLIQRWQMIFNRRKRLMVRELESNNNYQKVAKDTGYEIYQESIYHRELLAGQQTEEYYLTSGYYHGLADETILGWHPDWESTFKRGKESANL